MPCTLERYAEEALRVGSFAAPTQRRGERLSARVSCLQHLLLYAAMLCRHLQCVKSDAQPSAYMFQHAWALCCANHHVQPSYLPDLPQALPLRSVARFPAKLCVGPAAHAAAGRRLHRAASTLAVP